MKKLYYTQRIGGVPTVLRRGDGFCKQVAQHGTMTEAKADAARLNMNAEYA